MHTEEEQTTTERAQTGEVLVYAKQKAFSCLSREIEDLLTVLPQVSMGLVSTNIHFRSVFLIFKTEELSHI